MTGPPRGEPDTDDGAGRAAMEGHPGASALLGRRRVGGLGVMLRGQGAGGAGQARSSGCSRRGASAPGSSTPAPCAPWTTSSTRPWPGSTGTTAGACTPSSATSHPPNTRRSTTVTTPRPLRSRPENRTSTETGAVQFLFALDLTATKAATAPLYLVSFITSEGLFLAQLSAAGLVVSVPVIIAGWVAQDRLVQGLSLGVVK